MRYAFPPWAPDSASVDNNILIEARNVYPAASGYMPVPALVPFSSNSIAEKTLLIKHAKTSTGAFVCFVFTATKIYREVDGVLTDYSRSVGGAYNATDADKWDAVQFGQYLIACNPNDDVQVIDVDSGATNFTALGGTPPRARYVDVVGNFVILSSLTDNPRAFRNSAIENHQGWTVGTDLCDEQTIPSGGRITGFVGGEFGFIAQERAIRKLIFSGSIPAFRVEIVDEEIGCASGYGMVGVGNAAYFPSDNGFMMAVGSDIIPIGADAVDTWFGSNSDGTRFYEVQGFLHPTLPLIGWAFYNTGGDTNYNRIIYYNRAPNVERRWSYVITEVQFVTSHATSGVTLEGLDVLYPSGLDSIPISLDSRTFQGGRPSLVAVNGDGYLSFFDGSSSLTGILQTSTMQLNPGYRSKNIEAKLLGELNGAAITLEVGKREHTGEAWTYTSPAAASTRTGWARQRASGAYHTFKWTIAHTAGVRWTLLQGMDVNATQDGQK